MNTLSKREQIAAMAMQGLASLTHYTGNNWAKNLAKDAVEASDALLAKLEMTSPQPVCEWKEDEDGNWDTGCGNTFSFDEGGPEDNKSRFCCYCGKGVKAVKFRDRIEKQPDPEGWIPHTPGDPMPCDGNTFVRLRTVDGDEFMMSAGFADSGDSWWSNPKTPDQQITHWKPA